MEAQQAYSDDVEDRDGYVLKTKNHHAVYVWNFRPSFHGGQSEDVIVRRQDIRRQVVLEVLFLHRAKRELSEVIKDKDEYDVARPADEAGRETRCNPRLDAIGFATASATVLDRENSGRPDMDHYADQKDDARGPKRGPELTEDVRVAVDLIGIGENL